MRRLDRYIVTQMLLALVFFLLVLGGVVWLLQALKIIDLVISSGESALVFLTFTLYVLPSVLIVVLPICAFAAALFVINKLYSETELVVMMLSGLSPFSLARPIAIFAAICTTLTLVATLILLPAGARRLAEGQAEIRGEIANALIREGQFLHPEKGLTIFIRKTDARGQMAGLFLHDERDPEQPVTYTAERAALLRDGDLARLVMSQGVALTQDIEDDTLSQVRFEELVYDLSSLVKPVESADRPEAFTFAQLTDPTPAMLDHRRYDRAYYLAAAHERIVIALNAFALPLLALGVLLTGNYQRRGFTLRVMAAVALGTLLIAAGLGMKSAAIKSTALWPLLYLPSIATIAAAFTLLSRASRARRATTGPSPAGTAPT